MQQGGKIVTPIRDAMSNPDLDGVAFRCKDKKSAEQTRISAIVAKHRNNLDFKTHVDKENTLFIYKENADIFEDPNYIVEDLRD